jgi:tetratricopeptide (TPR) repeat protein
MYLRGSKWNMRRRRPRVNWVLVVVVLVLIAIVTYIDRYILPTAQTPFLPTLTATRDPESYAVEAAKLFDQGKLIPSIDTYREAIRINPEDPALYLALARVQIFAGQYDEALTDAEDSLLLNNNNSMAYAVRGWALTYKQAWTDADESLKSALRLDQTNGLAHAYNAFLYGKMYENDAGPYPDPIQTAIDESNTAISLAPNSLEARWARAYILALTSGDNLELAVEQYQLAIKINPNIAQIHLELGVTYRLLGVIDKALEEYTLANTFNPSDYWPELYSSRADVAIGEYDKALQWAEKAVQDAPDNPELIGNWGYMLFKKDQYADANEKFALALDGGTTADGLTIQPLSPNAKDSWVSKYYYAYAISLADVGRCAEVGPLTQKLMSFFSSDPYAEINAQIALDTCTESLLTPSPRPASTPTSGTVGKPTTSPTP